MERKVNAAHELHTLPIINIYGDGTHFVTDKPRHKSYVSPYAKFDKIRRKRNGK